MQVARLLEPRPRRLRSKVIETFPALQLEARFGKEAVLGMWLTLAPRAAIWRASAPGRWPGSAGPPHALEPAEAALLLALARRPEAYRPNRHLEAARQARNTLLLQRDPAGRNRRLIRNLTGTQFGLHDSVFSLFMPAVPARV